MDWTKSKNLLIVALVVTNMVLLFAYHFKDDSFKSYDEDALINYLKNKNIVMETDIPEKETRMAVLAVEYDKIDEKKIEKVISGQQSGSNSDLTKEELMALTDGFLEKCGAMTESVALDKVLQKGKITTVRYKNVFEGIPIEESYMICTIEEGKVTKFDRYWLEPIKFADSKKEVIPASVAMMKFMRDNQEQDKVHVKSIELVYWLDQSTFNTSSSISDTVLPTWKITYDQGKIKHIPAFK